MGEWIGLNEGWWWWLDYYYIILVLLWSKQVSNALSMDYVSHSQSTTLVTILHFVRSVVTSVC